MPDATTVAAAPARTRRGRAPVLRRRAGTVALWALQVTLALVFAAAGAAKLAGSPEMVDMFADIGAGQGLRYLVGTAEVTGAVGLLVRPLAGLAALGLVALMVGATATNILVLEADPTLPVVLTVAAGGVAWLRLSRRRSRAGRP